MSRPKLAPVPLVQVLPLRPGLCYLTVSPGQWDVTTREAYRAGWVLLEMDDDDRPRRAYRRPAAERN